MTEKKDTKVVEKLKHTGAVTVPSLFTLGNVACGFFSILSAAKGNFAAAGWLILFAMIFDMFDGRMARLFGTESSFGVEMDSLADAVSFCTAPAMLMYFFVLHTQPTWGAPIACVYACFGVLRLAKFNAMAYAGESSKQYFSGLPTPAAAGILASFAISYSIMEGTSGGRNIQLLTAYLPHIYNFVWFVMLVHEVHTCRMSAPGTSKVTSNTGGSASVGEVAFTVTRSHPPSVRELMPNDHPFALAQVTETFPDKAVSTESETPSAHTAPAATTAPTSNINVFMPQLYHKSQLQNLLVCLTQS